MNSSDICWLLRKKYCLPEFSIAFEVGNSTGFATKRHLDAISMSLYPSRGLNLTGYEIKIDRQDLKREISNPDKAEEVAKFLDFFFVVYPKELNVLDLEIPAGWGLIEASEDNLKIIKPPDRISAAPLTRSFVAALFRSMCVEDVFRSNRMIEDKMKTFEADFDRRVKVATDLRRSEHTERIEWTDNLLSDLKSAGFDWKDLRWSEPEFARAIKTAMTHQSLSIDRVERACAIMEQCVVDVRSQMEHLMPAK